MASEITKVSVVDSRILQQKPKFAVEKGPLSLTNVPYRSITQTQSQMTFNIIVPSESVFIDRAVDWTSTVFASIDVTVTAGTADANYPIAVYGRDCALAPFPLNQLCSTMSATINDTTTVVNSQDVANTLLRLTDYKKNRKVRTCPSKLDNYYHYPTSAVDTSFSSQSSNGQSSATLNSPLNNFSSENNVDEKPNGSWGAFSWTMPDGTIPSVDAVVPVTPGGMTTPYKLVNGQPVTDGDNLPGVGAVYRLYYAFKSTERLLISPFIFADDNEISTGLFGIQNIQLLMNFQSLPAGGRLLRCANNPCLNSTNSCTVELGNQQWNLAGGAGSPFGGPTINIQYLTPSLDVPLPAKNLVPYMDYPRYISQGNQTAYAQDLRKASLGALSYATINSQTITLPAIPDLLCIYVKPNSYQVPSDATYYSTQPDCTVGDWVLPISGISVNFDNYAGLLSSHTQEELYRMSVRNGLEMDFDQWRGFANTGAGSYATLGGPLSLPLAPLCGGPLLLKPGRDIVLQAGQAPSLVGNFSLQFTLQVTNQTGIDQTNLQVYVIAINSGYIETIKGSSRIIKGVLTEQDILSAPMGPGSADAHMGRMVGMGQISEAAEHMGHGRKHGHGHHKKMSKYQ